jgi:uncharacterized protein (TIGR00369 family)
MAQATAQRTGLDVLKDVAAFREPLPPCAFLLGWEAREMRPGFVRVHYLAREDFYNPQGNVQGGILAAMLDDAMGPAAFTLLPENAFAPTLELSVSYLRPARAGTLIAEGRVVHESRRFMRLEGSISTEEGQLIATARATVVINRASEGGSK